MLLDLFTKSIDVIDKELYTVIDQMTELCTKIIGQGHYGFITERQFGKSIKIKVSDDLIVKIPAVTKLAHLITNDKSYTDKIIYENILYIYSHNNLLVEGIMNYILSLLWFRKVTIHVSPLLALNKCDNDIQLIVEKQGKYVNFKYETQWSFMFKTPEIKTLYNINSLTDLIIYMLNTTKDNIKSELPNGKTVNICEIIDNFLISYVYLNYIILHKYGLILTDQHMDNLLVHWLHSNSWIGDKNISECKYIYYEIAKDKYLKIETHGIIYKLGDIGASIMILNSDLILIGELNPKITIKEAHEQLDKIDMFVNYIFSIIYWPRDLPEHIVSKTILGKLIKMEPYSKMSWTKGNLGKLNGIHQPLELLNLDIFDKYLIKDNPKNDKHTFIHKMI